MVQWSRDPLNIAITVTSPNGHHPSVYFRLRDRRRDGTPASTPPKLLQVIGGLSPDKIPPESHELGVDDWYHAAPCDRQPPDRQSVEFSIASANPGWDILTMLRNKQEHLFTDPDKLADFIHDPFAALPVDPNNTEALKIWYRNWWQVVNRGLRGKTIPYPGQTALQGYKGFFKHAVARAEQLLYPLGFTHLTAVPTWYYVWALNLAQGFQPDDINTHLAASEFFELVKYTPVPDVFKQQRLIEYGERHPLLSWFSVLPFAMMGNHGYIPELGLPSEHERNFNGTVTLAKNTYGNRHYPLLPGKNLWHSKPIAQVKGPVL